MAYRYGSRHGLAFLLLFAPSLVNGIDVALLIGLFGIEVTVRYVASPPESACVTR